MKKTLIMLGILYMASINASSLTEYQGINQLDNIELKSTGFQENHLYINNKEYPSLPDFYTMSIMGKADINGNKTYILWGGSGGSVDRDFNLHYFFITIDKQGVISISQKAPEGDIKIVNNMLKVKYHNDKAYADINDFGYYTYNPTSNKITITQPPKNEAYYNNKFAKYTATEIINKIKHENCYMLSDDNQVLEFGHACTYGRRYCYMFKQVKTKSKGSDYNLLENTCKNQFYDYTPESYQDALSGTGRDHLYISYPDNN